MVAGLQKAQQHRTHRAHAAAGGHAILATLDGGHLQLKRAHGRVAAA